MQAHPLAELFPLIDGNELKELADSIRQEGQREPIVLYEGKILDGRNRFQACGLIGAIPTTIPFNGGDPLRFVIQQNLARRLLNESQRGLIACTIKAINAAKEGHKVKVLSWKNHGKNMEDF